MHLLIRSEATDVVGVELSAELVEKARLRGVHLVEGDAERVRLGRLFDVVFAGELIEHLSDASRLLATARVHLRPSGMLVITTPNPYAVSNFIYRLTGRAHVHGEHTCWYCEDTLPQLVSRHGFEPVRVEFLRHRTPGTLRRVVSDAVRLLLPDRLARNTLMVVAVLDGPDALSAED